MRVLMSGASGFVGANVLDFLLEHTDWDFVVPCSWRHRGYPIRMETVLSNNDRRNRVKIMSVDLRHPLPALGWFDYILDFASESHVDRSIQHPVDFIENNVSVALTMLEYARHHDCKHFIHFSTDEVFGPDGEGPSSPYAASKAAQESIAYAYRRTYGVPVTVLNCSNIVGPLQNAEKFIPKVASLIRAEKRIEIHTNNGKIGARYYYPVENVANAVMEVLQDLTKFSYQLGPGTELTNLEMADKISTIIGTPMYYNLKDVGDLRPGYDDHYHYTRDNFLDVPVVSLEQSLERAVNSSPLLVWEPK